jgi:hypothetical protein
MVAMAVLADRYGFVLAGLSAEETRTRGVRPISRYQSPRPNHHLTAVGCLSRVCRAILAAHCKTAPLLAMCLVLLSNARSSDGGRVSDSQHAWCAAESLQ